ncbi:hypothetical protein AYI69_g11355 [Smittium culicis]|uniref:Secreted protein n=1 Tax=Smittium culicis TaxID=133412 RepID=A0A1R1WZB5_9FUNG|nr:hypothetical protein AYI69_g11355 [Smittium culicis]
MWSSWPYQFPTVWFCIWLRSCQMSPHRSVHSLPDLVLVVLDRTRYIPLAIHNIAQVGVLVGGVDFFGPAGSYQWSTPRLKS